MSEPDADTTKPTVRHPVWESSRVSEERPVGDPPGTATPGDAATAQVPAPASVHVTRLISEAASKSGLIWVRLPDGDAHPVWHVWHDDGDERGTGPAAYVVSGPGEQSLPWLPDEVELLLRSKDTGGRLIAVRATAREVTPEDAGWDAAVEVLRPGRLNAVGDVAQRWRRVVHHPRADAARPARRGPRLVRRGVGGRARSGPPRRRPAAGAPGTGAVGPAPAATPAPERAARSPTHGIRPDSLSR